MNPNSLIGKPVPPGDMNELTGIIDVGKRTQDTITKVGLIGGIILVGILIVVIVLMLKNRKKA